jgi:hypothetical protein
MQANEPDQATVLDIARRVVAEAAPAEAPLFDAVADAYLEHPAAFLSDTGSSDDMLGFGGLEAVNLVTPLVLGQVQVLCAGDRRRNAERARRFGAEERRSRHRRGRRQSDPVVSQPPAAQPRRRAEEGRGHPG